MKVKARINNKIVDVEIIDGNYNDHAKEVKVLNGTFKGKYTIVENNDFIVDTYSQLVNICKADIEDLNDLENNHMTDLISLSTYNFIKNMANKYTLSKSNYYNIVQHPSFENCSNIEEVKTYILIDSLNLSLQGVKSSFTSVKNTILKELK